MVILIRENGVFVNNNDGTVDYTPNSGYTGTDQISYEICDNTAPIDGGPLCDTATIYVTVSANMAPDAVNDSENTPSNTPIFIDVLSNDSDPDGNTLSIAINTSPSNGSAVVQNGQVLYTPDIGYTGTDIFTYQICDGACVPLCDIATVTVDIACDPIPNQNTIVGTVFYDADASATLNSGDAGTEWSNGSLIRG